MLFITALDKNTIRRIHTGQVITSTESIVKELLENSLDANADAIDVRLVNEGLQKIEVRDNGCGIPLSDRSNMAKLHYTSKISSFTDLEYVETYGFRGEALSSLCEISGEVFITTKTKHDAVAICYKLDRNGNILSESASGSIPQTGTMVSIYQPFAHLPVRRQVAEKNKMNTVKRIHELMVKYGLSHPLTRLSLNQQQNTLGKTKGQPVWIKPSTTSLTEGVRVIYGATLASMVDECSFEENFDQVNPNDMAVLNPIRLHCLLPSKSSDPSQIFRGERVFMYVDKRPINYARSDLKELIAMVRQRYKKCLGLEDDTKKIPFMYIDIQTGFGGYDVNIEPDKSVVMFVGKGRLMDAMQELLDQTYGSFFNNHPSLPATERHSSKSSLTMQEVPCHSPEHTSNNTPQSSSSPSMEVDSPILDNTLTDIELDEFDDNINEPSTANPPSLNENLQQHLCTDGIYEKSISTNRSPIRSQNQQCPVTENTTLDWQIDDASDIISTAPTSPAKIQQPSPHHDDEPTNQLSDWFAQFRRPSNSHHNSTKRPAANHYPTSSPPSQTKRPKTLVTLPFTRSHSTSVISPILSNLTASVPIVSSQLSPNITNTSLPSPMTIPSHEMYNHHNNEPISPPTISTPNQPILCEQPFQTRSILTDSSTTSRRRDITKFFITPPKPSPSSSSSVQVQGRDTNLISTLNETTTLESSRTVAELATGYNLYRQRYALLHGKSVTDYHQQALLLKSTMTNDQQKQSTWDTFLLGSKTNRDLALFTKGTYTDIGWVENCLAVMNIKTLQQRSKFQMLMEEYELKCGKPLTVPVQVKISDSTPFYGVVISLDKKEQCVANDGHGLIDQTYSTITDKLITANGFRVRWRKEPYAHELVVQFTAISDLNGYGPAEFNEILENIGHHMHEEQQQPTDYTGRLAPLKKIRPAKVVDYFASMVKDISGSTPAKSSESDWQDILTTFDEETQNRYTNSKTPQPAPIHHLI